MVRDWMKYACKWYCATTIFAICTTYIQYIKIYIYFACVRKRELPMLCVALGSLVSDISSAAHPCFLHRIFVAAQAQRLNENGHDSTHKRKYFLQFFFFVSFLFILVGFNWIVWQRIEKLIERWFHSECLATSVGAYIWITDRTFVHFRILLHRNTEKKRTHREPRTYY